MHAAEVHRERSSCNSKEQSAVDQCLDDLACELIPHESFADECSKELVCKSLNYAATTMSTAAFYRNAKRPMSNSIELPKLSSKRGKRKICLPSRYND